MNTDRNSDIVVVLDRPQDAVNIGAVVRAVKNMGFSQLRLVNPRPFNPRDLARVAHHAEDVIAAIGILPRLMRRSPMSFTSSAHLPLPTQVAPCAGT